MPEITIPSILIDIIKVGAAFIGAFLMALWVSLIVWTFRDARSRSRDAFAVILATLMAVFFGPLGVLVYMLLRPPVTLAELYERSLEEEALLQDLEERDRCPGCSRLVENNWIVCPDCHTQLKRICLNCGEKLHLRWNICPHCATGINQAGPVATVEQPVAIEADPEPALIQPPRFSRPPAPPETLASPEEVEAIAEASSVEEAPAEESEPEAEVIVEPDAEAPPKPDTV